MAKATYKGWGRLVVTGAGLLALGAGLGGCGGGGGGGLDGGTGATGATGTGGATKGRPAPAYPIFDDTRLHQVELKMSAEDWQSILDDSRGDEQRHATLVYDGVTVDDVGVSPSGESSRFAGNPKMSVQIKFDAFPNGGPFAGVEEIKLKGQYGDQSMMRERLAYSVYRAVIPTPQEAHVRLVVNGDVRGVYAIREVWDADSIKAHFSEPLGPLYRIRGWKGLDPYLYLGSDPALYVPAPWDRHIDKATTGDEVLPPALQVVNDAPATLGSVFDIDTLDGYLAATAVVMNTDGLVGDSGPADHYQYYDPATKKFFTLPWDPDNTFGSANEPVDRYIYARFSRTKLTVAVRDIAELQQPYKAKIADVLNKFPLSMLNAEIDRIYDQIKDAAHEDMYKPFGNDVFDWNPSYLKMTAAARYAFLSGEVASP